MDVLQQDQTRRAMIDMFTLLLVHGLLALAGLRLLSRQDLDSEEIGTEEQALPDGEAGPDA
ncbi:hypothetical protein GCM10022213_20280 [Parerythrobacter jejuensis]